MILATIPMRNHHEDTERVLEQCLIEDAVEEVVIFDNDSDDACCHKWLAQVAAWDRVLVLRHEGRDNFYGMWNRAWQICERMAPAGEPAHLAVLNNDIVLAPNALTILSDMLAEADDDIWITYPDWKMGGLRPRTPHTLTRTTGTRNLGGMSGYCFMLDARIHTEHDVPYIDEQFELLCGDGDLIEQIQARGGTAARVDGLPLAHNESATQHDPRNRKWTQQARRRDRRRRAVKYGDRET